MSTQPTQLTLGGRVARRFTRSSPPGVDNFSHPDRTEWMLGHIPAGARAFEIGCGTGWSVTLPLQLAGVSIIGADLDEQSISYGKQLFRREGGDESSLKACDVAELEGQFDVGIASELFEHLHDGELEAMLEVLRRKLSDGGTLLVTVPNGYGWYELEALVWKGTPLGRLVEASRLGAVIRRLKLLFVSGATQSREPNTLSSCPHARRFTLRDLLARLRSAGFEPIDVRGSVMFCGPFTNLMFGGARSLQRRNVWLARRLPALSSGFYVAARLRGNGGQTPGM